MNKNKTTGNFIRIMGPLIMVAALSACESKENTTTIVTKDTLGNEVADYEIKVKETKSEEKAFEDRLKEENKDIKIKLDSLRDKIKIKGNKVDAKAKQVIDELEQERKEFDLKKADEKIEARWKEFKEKVNAEIDSLDRRI